MTYISPFTSYNSHISMSQSRRRLKKSPRLSSTLRVKVFILPLCTWEPLSWMPFFECCYPQSFCWCGAVGLHIFRLPGYVSAKPCMTDLCRPQLPANWSVCELPFSSCVDARSYFEAKHHRNPGFCAHCQHTVFVEPRDMHSSCGLMGKALPS